MFDYACKVLRVVDGDTVECDLDLGFYMRYRTKVRLAGINAPEMSTPDGAPAKDRLTVLLASGGEVVVHTKLKKEFDKYGRVLGTFYVGADAVPANAHMINEGFAIPYMM